MQFYIEGKGRNSLRWYLNEKTGKEARQWTLQIATWKEELCRRRSQSKALRWQHLGFFRDKASGPD